MSPTGNSQSIVRLRQCIPKATDPGFTLAECLAAVAILSLGVVFIYRALLGALDSEAYLCDRLYAGQLLQNHMDLIEVIGTTQQEIPPHVLSAKEPMIINHRPLEFSLATTLAEFENGDGLMQFSSEISWREGERTIRLPQSGFISQTMIQ